MKYGRIRRSIDQRQEENNRLQEELDYWKHQAKEAYRKTAQWDSMYSFAFGKKTRYLEENEN